MPRAPKPTRLGSGFARRPSSSSRGAATQAITAAALSQIPRLNSAVFLKEMTRMAVALPSAGCLFQQRMPLGQLVRVPRREAVADGLLGNLLFRHRRNDLVVHEQAIDVQRLVARRVGRLEFDRAPPFSVLNAGQQCRLEQFRLMFAF